MGKPDELMEHYGIYLVRISNHIKFKTRSDMEYKVKMNLGSLNARNSIGVGETHIEAAVKKVLKRK